MIVNIFSFKTEVGKTIVRVLFIHNKQVLYEHVQYDQKVSKRRPQEVTSIRTFCKRYQLIPDVKAALILKDEKDLGLVRSRNEHNKNR